MEVLQFAEFVSKVGIGALGWIWAFIMYKRNIELATINLNLVQEQVARTEKRYDMLEQRFLDMVKDRRNDV